MRKAAKLEAKGIIPPAARPAAIEHMFASAMPTSKNRSLNLFPNSPVWVDLARSASRTTMRGFSSPNSASVRP